MAADTFIAPQAEKGNLQSKLAEAEQSLQQQVLDSADRVDAAKHDAARAAADASHKHNR